MMTTRAWLGLGTGLLLVVALLYQDNRSGGLIDPGDLGSAMTCEDDR